MGDVINFPTMTKKMEIWPNRIREWRLGRDFTQAELGEMVGLTGVMISHLETGKRDPGLKQLQSLARALQVDTVDLLSKQDNPLLMGEGERDFMRVYAHVPDGARPSLQSVAENLAGFRAQPAVLEMPATVDAANAKGKSATKRKGSAAA